MRKIKKFLLKNIKLVVAFIVGIIIAGTSAYAATILYTSNKVSYNNSSSGAQATSVKGALDLLYAKASNCSSSPPVAIGDYISLTPTKTSYTIKKSITGYLADQTINPSQLTVWRVIDIHNDGSFDVVSEYVSSTVYFRGTTGYAKFVGALNTIAAQYQVPGYTIDARHMGYGGQTSIIGDTSSFDGTTITTPTGTTTPSPTTGTGEEYGEGVSGDTLYLKDYLLVKSVYGSTGLKAYKVGTTTYTAYWLTSRHFDHTITNVWGFNGRYVNTSGDLGTKLLRRVSSGWDPYSGSYAVRPILTLKSGLTISGGAGTKASPYTLS